MVRRASYQGAPELLLNEAERAIAIAADVACTAAAAGASEDSQAISRKAEGARASGATLGGNQVRLRLPPKVGPSTPSMGHDQHGCGHAGWATPSVAQDGQLVA
jgi:hypothetical protein